MMMHDEAYVTLISKYHAVCMMYVAYDVAYDV